MTNYICPRFWGFRQSGEAQSSLTDPPPRFNVHPPRCQFTHTPHGWGQPLFLTHRCPLLHKTYSNYGSKISIGQVKTWERWTRGQSTWWSSKGSSQGRLAKLKLPSGEIHLIPQYHFASTGGEY